MPYDADGQLLPEDQRDQLMVLDLNDGQTVRITPGHNIQGAEQPPYMHIGAKHPVKYEGIERQPAPGHGVVVRRENDTVSFVLQLEGEPILLGIWWLDSAIRGAVPALPIVNLRPTFESAKRQPPGLSLWQRSPLETP